MKKIMVYDFTEGMRFKWHYEYYHPTAGWTRMGSTISSFSTLYPYRLNIIQTNPDTPLYIMMFAEVYPRGSDIQVYNRTFTKKYSRGAGWMYGWQNRGITVYFKAKRSGVTTLRRWDLILKPHRIWKFYREHPTSIEYALINSKTVPSLKEMLTATKKKPVKKVTKKKVAKKKTVSKKKPVKKTTKRKKKR